MKSAFKWILAIAGSLAGLVVIAAIVVPLLVNPNDFKPQIEQVVQDRTGRQLRIEGDIGLSVFPWLGLELGALQLNNPPGFGDTPFLRVESARVHVKLMPLLRKRIEIDNVSLQGLRLALVRNQAGKGNWEGMAGAEKRGQEGVAAAAGDGGQLPALEIGGVTIRDAGIRFTDLAQGVTRGIENFSLDTGPLAAARPMDIALSFELSSDQPRLDGRVSLKAVATVDPQARRFRLDDVRLTTDLNGDDLPGGGLQAALGTDVSADMQNHTMQIANLVFEAAGLRLTADVDCRHLNDKPRFSGRLALAEFSPRDVAQRLDLAVPDTSDPEVLKRMSLKAAFKATMGSAVLDELALVLDDTRISGRAEFAAKAGPARQFALALDAIDLDRYLPPPEQRKVRQARENTPADQPLPIPVDTLRALDMSGTVDIRLLKVAGLTSRDVHLEVLARKGRLRVHPAAARLYGGEYKGDLQLDVSGQTPVFSVNEHLVGIQASPLLRDMLGNDRLVGTGNVNAVFTTRGQTLEALRANLNGKVDIAFTDGAVKGVNIARMIREARARLQGRKAPPAGSNQTDFSELRASATATNGVLDNRDLRLKSPLLRITGAGRADLVREKIDYLLKTKITGTLEGQGGKELEELRGLTIPVRISGDLRSPSYRPELESVLKDKLESEAKKKVEKQKERLQDKLRDKLKNQLRLPF